MKLDITDTSTLIRLMEGLKSLLKDPTYTALVFYERGRQGDPLGFTSYVLEYQGVTLDEERYIYDEEYRVYAVKLSSIPPSPEELKKKLKEVITELPSGVKLFSAYYSWLKPYIEKYNITTVRYPLATPEFLEWMLDYLNDREVLWDLARLYEEEKGVILNLDIIERKSSTDSSSEEDSAGEEEKPVNSSTLIEYTRKHIPTGWEKFFDEEALEMVEKISRKIGGSEFYPPLNLVYRVFELVPPEKIRVVIIGQDPYINGEAMGISFSVPPKTKLPPSLRNIYQEMKDDGYPPIDPSNGDLTRWCKQGVFLINTALTVRPGESGSHMELWKEFTRKLLDFLNYRCGTLVIIMWGSPAQQLGRSFSDKHKKITSVHPSPLSASKGFFGSKPFSKANSYLKALGKKEIDWR